MGRWTGVRRTRMLAMAGLLALTMSIGLSPAPSQASQPHVTQVKKAKKGLKVTISGIPRGNRPRVVITGPKKFKRTITRTTVFAKVKPGKYRIRAATVTVPTGAYTPKRADFTVRVGKKHRKVVTVAYLPPRWSTVRSGGGAMCGLRNDAKAWCWGPNNKGQLGIGPLPPTSVPKEVGGRWLQIAPSMYHTCALDLQHRAKCWGDNTYGELGNASIMGQTDRPAEVADPSRWSEIATGYQDTCGIKTDRSAWCWGYNQHGQAGTGGSIVSYPQRIGAESDWASISPGYDATCGVRANHTLWCWGDNTDGQLGVPSPTSSAVPIQVPGTDWMSVSAGSSHACALKTNHSLWCWGRGTAGELGTNNPNTTPYPQQVGTAKDWRSAAAGMVHTCGIRAPGTLWCWGSNVEVQLGIGTTPDHVVVPTRVGTASDWTSVSAAESTTCGLRGIGTAWCWGAGNDSQIGNGDTSNGERPTAVRGP